MSILSQSVSLKYSKLIRDQRCQSIELENSLVISVRISSCSPMLLPNFSHIEAGLLDTRSRVDLEIAHPGPDRVFRMAEIKSSC
jgi:hypothetical protein